MPKKEYILIPRFINALKIWFFVLVISLIAQSVMLLSMVSFLNINPNFISVNMAIMFIAGVTVLPLGLFIYFITEKNKKWRITEEGLTVYGKSKEIFTWDHISNLRLRGYVAAITTINKLKRNICFVDSKIINSIK